MEVVKNMFYGSKELTIDDKGRLLLSSLFRDGFPGGTCFACYGMDNCIELYPETTYQERASQITKLNDFDEVARRVKRTFLSNTFMITIDSHSRILLPKPLLDKTLISKNVTIIGMYDHLELWDSDKYNKIQQENQDNYASDAKKLIGGS